MKWFTHQRMAAKLAIGFGLSFALTLAMGALSLRSMASMDALADEMVLKHQVGMLAIKDANLALIRTSRALRNALIEKTVEEKDARKQEIDRYHVDFDKALGVFEEGLVKESVREKTRKVEALFDEVNASNERVFTLTRAGRDAEALQALDAARTQANDIEAGLVDLEAEKQQTLDAALAQMNATYTDSRNLQIGVLVACAVLVILLVWQISRLVTRPLGQTVAVLQRVAKADFTETIAVDTRDEIGDLARAANAAITQIKDALANVNAAAQGMAEGDLGVTVRADLPGELGVMAGSLNEAIGKLRAALSDVRETANAVASSSDQLAAAATEISSGAQEQASSLEETAASLEEMTATIKQNADNAHQASQLASGARSTAEDGGQVVTQAVEAMSAINESSRKIADIITTIDEIAFQTNLLALNAAVEAARAGEQGRGFAVVAAEVRNLAQRSATAAKEIKSLISDSSRKVDAGSALVNASGTTLTEIVTAVKRVTDIVAEIAAASREQASGIEQVNKAVTQMDHVTQANASQTEEMSGTSESLSGEASKLQGLVRRFRLGDEATTTVSPKAPVRRPVAVVARGGRRTPPATAGSAALALDAEFQEF